MPPCRQGSTTPDSSSVPMVASARSRAYLSMGLTRLLEMRALGSSRHIRSPWRRRDLSGRDQRLRRDCGELHPHREWNYARIPPLRLWPVRCPRCTRRHAKQKSRGSTTTGSWSAPPGTQTITLKSLSPGHDTGRLPSVKLPAERRFPADSRRHFHHVKSAGFHVHGSLPDQPGWPHYRFFY